MPFGFAPGYVYLFFGKNRKRIKAIFYDCTGLVLIYAKEIHKKFKYKLDSKLNPDPDKEVIITANGPSGLLLGMNYSTDLASDIKVVKVDK